MGARCRGRFAMATLPTSAVTRSTAVSAATSANRKPWRAGYTRPRRYWAERIADGRVFQLPLGGASTNKPPVIASNQQNPHSLVVDATNVYWITTDGVWKRPIAGGKAVAIATEPGNRSPGDLTLDAASLYWTTHRDVVTRAAGC